MANKWTTTDIEKISTAFALKAEEHCFLNQDTLSGDEIVTCTEFPQVNFFILREVFTKWEENSERMKSPYFNFNNEEVIQAFSYFKNVLSQNILISKNDFGKLAQTACKKTLELYMNPSMFFVSDFRNLPDFTLTNGWIEKNKVFFKDFEWLLLGLKNKLNDHPSGFYGSKALEEIKKLLETHSEDYTQKINLIAEAAGLSLEVSEIPSKNEVDNDNLSFFERLVANPPKPQNSATSPISSPFEKFASRIPSNVNKQEPAILNEPAKEKPEMVKEVKSVPTEYKDIFADHNQPTLNDKLKPTESSTLADVQQKSKIESLKGSMSLNQKFSFLNTLFTGSLNDFDAALDELEKCNNLSEASELIDSKYAQKYQWNLEDPETEEFYLLVRRRFN